ncbi:MAG TPA: Gldg family protein [Stellaceae bacterium]|nr:Gldg family protein [Stellaceae bacterium]
MRFFWLIGEGLRSPAGRATGALAAIGLILVATNVIAARYATQRLDLTDGRLYTLARGTRDTLARIDEPVTLRFYYSSRLGDSVPSYGVYAQRVRELLDQYVAAAKGKIRLEVYDPQPFTEAEDRAVAYGLHSAPLNEQGEAVYFGLAGTNSTDDQQVIAFFNPERERFLEYDLTRLVHALAFPKRTVVGLLSTLPLQGDPMAAAHGKPAEPLAIVSQLRQAVDIEPLSPEIAAIPKNIDVLMLVQPQHLSEATQFAIDQYVLKGGKALIFVDPYSEMQAALPHAPGAGTGGAGTGGGGAGDASPPAGELDRLFKAWGIAMRPGVVAADRLDARRVAVPVPGRNPQAMDYVGWLNLPADNLNHDDPITADLSLVTMASAGILEPVAGATTQFEPLIRTSTDAEQLPVDQIKGLPDVAGLLARFRPEQRRFVLAARVTGEAASAFPDGAPALPDGAPKPASAEAALKRSAQPINLVVVADTDMLDDRFWAEIHDFYGQRVVEPISNNEDFVANAVDVLAGGQDLVDLRSRGTAARPFTVVERIQRQADDRYAAEQQGLQQKLKQTQAKLHDLTAGDPGANPTALTAEQTKEIDRFRGDMLATRQQLRQVEAAAREDIRHLKVVLEFFDIALMPIVVIAAAIVIAALRPRSRRAARS